MQYQTVIYEKADAVATVTMNRPQALNALDLVMGDELSDCLTRCARDQEVRAVILTGAGRAFSGGGDVKYMQKSLEDPEKGGPQPFVGRLAGLLHWVITEVRRMEKPVIAAVNGVAAGAGFPLALCCDLIVAAESARFSMAYINIGVSPDGGSTFFLPRALGLHRANYYFFTGEAIDARKGYELGFVNQVVRDEELMGAARALAQRLAQAPTRAIALGKALVNRSIGDHLETQMEFERYGVTTSSGTEDFREGIAAFFQKRKPEFRGR